MELSLSVFTTYVCRGWDSNTQPSACEVNALTHCATVAVIPKHFITLLQSTLWLKQHLWQLKKGQLIKTLGSVFIENAAVLYRQLLDQSTGHDDIVGINETFIMIQIVVSKSVRIRIMKLRSDGKKEHWKKSVPNKIYSKGEASGLLESGLLRRHCLILILSFSPYMQLTRTSHIINYCIKYSV